MYIYISNEEQTPIDVFFDDFKVTQNMSEVVAGADYYPFGLPIPERELTREPYRYGYQGQFSEKDKETGFNFFDLRMYDARIGRWVSPDPYGQYASAYVGMGNNPVTGIDPDGGFCPTCFWELFQSIQNLIGTMLDEVVVTAPLKAATSSASSSILTSIAANLSKALSFTSGVGDALKSNMSLGVIQETNPNTQANSSDYASGQKFGRYASIVVGAGEAALGYLTATGGGAATLTGGGAVVGAPAIAGGLTMVGHGGATTVYAWNNLNKVHHVNSSGSSSGGGGGKNFPKEFGKELQKIKQGQGTPRKNPDGSQKVFEARELSGKQKWKWKGALEWDVPGTNHRILQKINPDGTSTFGRVVNHNYNTIYPF